MDRLSFPLLILIGTLFSSMAQASTCTVNSPAHKVALLELYTSEGCSSCPPADKWLSQLGQRGLDAEQVVPLSLHVDYWNYIGWRDPYSSSQYTNRQKEIARRNRLRTIYTPQMVLQGEDFRSWRRVDFAKLLQRLNTEKAVADISVNIVASSPRVFDLTITASVRDTTLHAGSRLLLAVFENNLSSEVTAGENHGRLLKHDYVVRQLLPAVQLAPDGKVSHSQQLVVPAAWDSSRVGVAAFIEHPRHGTLQATATNLSCG
jgi:hypothetical protein